MTSARGRFITLEGLEGVGKTTNKHVIETCLQQRGIDYIATREPGGTEVGEQLRALVLHADGDICAESELLIMAASRVELVARLIEPALANGQWVLCDRYLDASVAYQGAGRQLGTQRVLQLHTLIGVTLRPDLTVLLDMPVEQGLARMSARAEPDRIEREEVAFFERAREAYLQQARDDAQRFVVVDASRSAEAVGADIIHALQQFIDTRR